MEKKIANNVKNKKTEGKNVAVEKPNAAGSSSIVADREMIV